MYFHTNISLSRSSDQQNIDRSSSFHAYYATHGNKDKTKDLDVVGEGEPSTAIPGLTVNVDERRTSRVQFKEEIKEGKNEEGQTEEDKTTERDLEAEFAGNLEGPD